MNRRHSDRDAYQRFAWAFAWAVLVVLVAMYVSACSLNTEGAAECDCGSSPAASCRITRDAKA